MDSSPTTANREIEVHAFSGWPFLVMFLCWLPANLALLLYSIIEGTGGAGGHPIWTGLIISVISFPVIIVLMTGFFTLQPNEARVLILFGRYRGTVRQSGFHWANPFYTSGPSRQFNVTVQMADAQNKGPGRISAGSGQRQVPSRNKISLRARTLNMDPLKVNDKRGNPIEIAAVVVWRVQDTAQAMFDVDNYENYVQTQSETSLRHLASSYCYDHGEPDEITLRSGVDSVSQALRDELQNRLNKAGVSVDEARLSHLAYAPEIAQAMLRRQQAEAVIDARAKIVHGAVSMVDMALRELAEKHVVQLDDERKAAMVSNLMVVLCGESEVHPVVNAGTLYS
jgi:regulator of protease activity HflC (stomatin/prohibitin superfamily)